jgi:hypothetical protein
MVRTLLITAVLAFSSPALVSADDIFFAFGENASATGTSTTTADAGSGSINIYSDGPFAFDGADVRFTNSDSSVVEFTGGEVFNPEYFVDPARTTSVGRRFDDPTQLIFGDPDDPNDPNDLVLDPATDGRLLVVGITENGINPNLGMMFDDLYQDDVGPNGAFLLARVDYDIVGEGTANFSFTLGPNGVVELVNNPNFDEENPDDPANPPLLTIVKDPSFRSAALTVGPAVSIPEPSALMLLVLGSVGLVARRKRI